MCQTNCRKIYIKTAKPCGRGSRHSDKHEPFSPILCTRICHINVSDRNLFKRFSSSVKSSCWKCLQKCLFYPHESVVNKHFSCSSDLSLHGWISPRLITVFWTKVEFVRNLGFLFEKWEILLFVFLSNICPQKQLWQKLFTSIVSKHWTHENFALKKSRKYRKSENWGAFFCWLWTFVILKKWKHPKLRLFIIYKWIKIFEIKYIILLWQKIISYFLDNI